MVRCGPVARLLLALAGALAVPACKNGAATPIDGGPDAPNIDGPSGDVPGSLALSFAVTGCADYILKPPRCTGSPPLTVSFSPVSSASLTRFLWTFGDGTPPSSERVPTHTYVLPGTYDVTVVADGQVGSVALTLQNVIDVSPVAAGATCDVDAQCAKDLRCLCGAGAACGGEFPRGICTSACDQAACGAKTVCATLIAPAVGSTSDGGADAPDAGADASDAAADAGSSGDGAAAEAGTDASAVGPRALCLASCANGVACPAGLACRALPAAGVAATGWAQSCVPPALRDVGEPCRDATGALDDTACATGMCADLGALGVCSAACGAGRPCPTGTACATLGNGQSLCLRGCDADFRCARDPLLRCEPAAGAGALGFQIAQPTAGATYCAPRRCAVAADCAPAGACVPLGAGGHCERP